MKQYLYYSTIYNKWSLELQTNKNESIKGGSIRLTDFQADLLHKEFNVEKLNDKPLQTKKINKL